MPLIQAIVRDKRLLQISVLWALLITLIVGLASPLLLNSNNASAAQLTTRSVTIGTSKPTTSTSYVYTFTTPTSGTIQSLAFQACTTPLGTCTSPGAGTSMNAGTSTLGSGWTDSATNFTRNASAAATLCTAAANMVCYSRTSATSETTGARTITLSSQTNPTTVGSYFIRITTFSDTAWVTAVDSGVVAYAVVNQLTVNARIQEILNFCVGTTSVDDATTSPGADCSAISGTTVDIGVLDSGTVNTSPVNTNGGSNTNGVAMVRTNAQNGVVISYFAEQNTSSGSLKVAGASCGSTVMGSGSTTDQCVNSVGTTRAAIVAGAEGFGMAVGGVNCGSNSGSYTCDYSAGNTNLRPDTQYVGGTFSAGVSGTYGASGFAWDDTGTVDFIASSASSTVKVVDDEALILKFAATPSITTPTGAYTVTSTYIATATY